MSKLKNLAAARVVSVLPKLIFFPAEGDWQFAPDISIVILMFIGRVLYDGFWDVKVIFKNSRNIEFLQVHYLLFVIE